LNNFFLKQSKYSQNDEKNYQNQVFQDKKIFSSLLKSKVISNHFIEINLKNIN
jgi:hypothetical protein